MTIYRVNCNKCTNIGIGDNGDVYCLPSRRLRKNCIYIEDGHAVEVLAEYYPEEERDQMREIFAEILNQVPDVKQKRGHWVRDSEADLRAPGLRRYYCSCCYKYNETRSAYCPDCGAYMRAKK